MVVGKPQNPRAGRKQQLLGHFELYPRGAGNTMSSRGVSVGWEVLSEPLKQRTKWPGCNGGRLESQGPNCD